MSRARRVARHRSGLRAEWFAACWLQLKGYRIVARRYKTPVGEIDLIARRRQLLVFVEVKGRRALAQAAESIHTRNQQRVVRAAHYYRHAHPEFVAYDVRFDALLITWYQLPHHIPHAFEARD